ncbi:MAG: prohibitin family protein [Planctomycetaceae bacterium]|nr:prohibitin family protein [Planctomycetaceae bacterium]
MKTGVRDFVGFVTLLIVAAVALTIYAGYYTVDQGERAIVLRFGEVTKISEPGFHLKFPFMDSVKNISVRSTKLKNEFAVYSKDVQGADVMVSVNYSLNPAFVTDIYTKYGTDYEARIINPQIVAKAKDAFGRHNAVETIQSRDALAKMVLDDLQEYFTDTGLVFESVQIENIDFSDEYERSVEERMKAEVEVAKVRQNLEREKINADMVRTKASADADAKVASAQAQAESIVMIGNAEATAIRTKSAAIANSPAYVSYMQAERWNGQLPSTVLPAAGVMPILDLRGE